MSSKRDVFPESCPWCEDPMVITGKENFPATGEAHPRTQHSALAAEKNCPAWEHGYWRDIGEWNDLVRNGRGLPAAAKKNRFILTTCDPEQLILFCQQAEDQGFTILNATISTLPAQTPQGTMLAPTAVVMAIIPRGAAKTQIELDAEAAATSKIVKLR